MATGKESTQTSTSKCANGIGAKSNNGTDDNTEENDKFGAETNAKGCQPAAVNDGSESPQLDNESDPITVTRAENVIDQCSLRDADSRGVHLFKNGSAIKNDGAESNDGGVSECDTASYREATSHDRTILDDGGPRNDDVASKALDGHRGSEGALPSPRARQPDRSRRLFSTHRSPSVRTPRPRWFEIF